MVKRLAAAAAVAAVAAIVWVVFNIATSAESEPAPSVESCTHGDYVDCVSYEAPTAPIAAPTVSSATPCKAWLGGSESIAMLSQCLHARAVEQDKASAEELRRRRAIAASS